MLFFPFMTTEIFFPHTVTRFTCGSSAMFIHHRLAKLTKEKQDPLWEDVS